MRYLVTGATGFIGKKLALKLIAQNHEVVAVVAIPKKPVISKPQASSSFRAILPISTACVSP